MKQAVVVIDMQHDFIDGSLANSYAQAIIEPMVQYLSSCKENGTDIFFTKDTHNDYLNSYEGKLLPIEHCIENTHGWDIVEPLLPFTNDHNVICKPTFGCLDLGDYLKDYDRVILIGTCTDICVISNAMILKAALPNTDIVIKEDLCAGLSKQAHDTALTAMKACQIFVE